MQVFKAYFKVVRSSVGVLALNFTIFLGLSVAFSFAAPSGTTLSFEPAKIPAAVINRDGITQITASLTDYLVRFASLKSFPDDEEALQDALFYREIEYVLIIPSGFSQGFMAEDGPSLQKVVVPGSSSSLYLDMNIDQFFGLLDFYKTQAPRDASLAKAKTTEEDVQTQLLTSLAETLALETKVTMQSFGGSTGERPGHSYYYAYSAFALLAMVISGVSSVMIPFNKPDLSDRNQCAPLPRRKANLFLAAGHSILALTCWGLFQLGSLVIYGKEVVSSGLLGMYWLNTLVFAAVAASIGLLVGNLVKTGGAQAGVINVISLGMSFLGGVFVPQEFMHKSVLTAAKFLPTYWFIRANDAIWHLDRFTTPGALSPSQLALRQLVIESMLIQLVFAAAIVLVTLIFAKEQSRAQ